MAKLGIRVYKAIFKILFFSILIIVLYSLGRFVHIFPPTAALIQIVKIKNIENNHGKKNLEYSMAVNKLADIYYENNFKRWAARIRIKALKTFVDSNLQNSIEYATCLYSYSEYLSDEDDKTYKATALLCQNHFLKLYFQNRLNDDSKRKLINILLSTFEFETNFDKRMELIHTAIKANNSIIVTSKNEAQNRILLLAQYGFYGTDNYLFWIDSQNSFDTALELSKAKEYNLVNTLVKISYARLLIKMHNYSDAKNLLESCNMEVVRKYPFNITYRKLLADILQGLGLTDEALKQLDAIGTLNYEKDPNIQFSTFYHKAQNKIFQGHNLSAYYYMLRIRWLIKKDSIKKDENLLNYYYLELLYNLKFDISKANWWKDKIKKLNIIDNQNIIRLLMAETQMERLLKNKTYFEKSLELYKTIHGSVISHFKYLTENQRLNYWRQYENVITTLYEAGFYLKKGPGITEACYNAALFSKGIVLGSSIEFSKLLTETRDTSLLLNYYQLLDVRAKIAQSPNTKSLNQSAERLERDLVQKSHEFGDYTNKMLIKWEDIRSNLKSNDIAIEFIDFPTGVDSTIYAALVLRKEWTEPKMITLFEGKQLAGLINNSPSKIYSTTLGWKISKLVWEPILPLFNPNDNIYFSPTNLLHKIAIESLPLKDSTCINKAFNLYRISSTKQLCFQRVNKNIASTVLYGGLKYSLNETELIQESRNYDSKVRGERFKSKTKILWKELPKTKEEVDSINTLLTNNKITTVLFTGSKGNEESFKQLSGSNYSIIHIATHGFFYNINKVEKIKYYYMGLNQPQIDNSLLRSGLILAGANIAWSGNSLPDEVEDGVLTAQDVATLNLRKTDIVVLSACDTGLGEITSEGVFGLQRAFKKAGVQTLLMSLWEVDDKATAIFMTSFYKHLVIENDKRKAFLEAQNTVRSIDKYKSPFYWAAFIMLD